MRECRCRRKSSWPWLMRGGSSRARVLSLRRPYPNPEKLYCGSATNPFLEFERLEIPDVTGLFKWCPRQDLNLYPVKD